jgi:hypothetical protein
MWQPSMQEKFLTPKKEAFLLKPGKERVYEVHSPDIQIPSSPPK